MILTLKEKRKYKSEKEFESEVKRKAQTASHSYFLHPHPLLEMQKASQNLTGFSLVARSIELSNLIWEGLEEIESVITSMEFR